MKYSDVIRLLLLLLLTMIMMTMMTHLHSSAEAQLSARFYSDDSDLEDLKAFAVALTPPPHALPPDVARLDAEEAADAAAIREEEAKTKEKLWQKAKESSIKHKQRQPQTSTENNEQEENGEMDEEKKEGGIGKMGQLKEHHHGNSQDSSRVQHIVSKLTYQVLKQLKLRSCLLTGKLYGSFWSNDVHKISNKKPINKKPFKT